MPYAASHMDDLEEIEKSGSETPETDALKSGTTFLGDRFHITTPVDDGDWDVVWVAHDQVRHSEETLKYLLDCSRMEEDELSLFCEDTKWALFQKHPNIVRVFKLRQPSRASKIAEKLVETPPVNSNAHLEHPFFEVSDIQTWIRILCEAMQRYHRERSPLEKEERPDRGDDHQVLEREPANPHDLSVSSRVADTVKRLTGSPTIFTTSYGSPEQALGHPPDEKQDVYAVGALIYDLLTGRPPFFTGDVMTQIYRVTPPVMSERRRQFGFRGALIPQRWETTVTACLEKEPEARPDFDELITLLFKEEGPITRKRSFPFAKAGASVVGASLFLSLISLCTIRDAESEPGAASPMVMKSSPARITEVAPLRAMLADRLPEDRLPAKSPTPLPEQLSSPAPDSMPRIQPVAELPKLSAEVIMNEAVKPVSPRKKESLFASLLKPRSNSPEPEIQLAVAEVDAFPTRPHSSGATEGPKVEPEIEVGSGPLIEREKPFLIEDLGLEMIWIDPLEIWVARTEVTQAQFNRSEGPNRSRYDGDDLACDSVSWNEAMNFCRWLTRSQREKGLLPSGFSYTLPTEAQWQVYVGNADLSQAVHGKSRSSGPSRPGTLPANEFGLVDVRGNLWEWTTTDFSSNPAKGKALLGGSFVSSDFMVMNPEARFYGALDNTYVQYGFRVVLTTDSPQNQE